MSLSHLDPGVSGIILVELLDWIQQSQDGTCSVGDSVAGHLKARTYFELHWRNTQLSNETEFDSDKSII